MPLFEDGQTASASTLESVLFSIRDSGQAVLDELAAIRTDTLLRFEMGLSALNNRRRLSSRLTGVEIPCRFLVSDFLDIDQSKSSATIRIDGGSATLRERNQAASIVVRSQRFTSSTGNPEQFGQTYRVHVTDGTKPSGTFDIELVSVSDLTFLSLDIVSIPSDPGLAVYASHDGVVYVPASSVSIAGYRINSWFPSVPAKYIRLVVSPTHSDTIGGTTFTFGITGASASTVDFHLASSLLFSPILFSPAAANLRFMVDADSGLTYFLTLSAPDGTTTSLSVIPGQVVSVPTATPSVLVPLVSNSAGILGTGTGSSFNPYVVPSDIYLNSVFVKRIASDLTITFPRVAPGYNPASHNTASSYLGIHDNRFEYGPVFNVLDLFEANFSRGPISISASLSVQFFGRDKSVTPVFRGARLEAI